MKKRQAIIVIFEIKARPQALGHLVYKTEDAFVVAPAQQHLIEGESHRDPRYPRNVHFVEFVIPLDFDSELSIGAMNPKIDEVGDWVTVDGANPVASGEPRLLTDAVGFNFADLDQRKRLFSLRAPVASCWA